MEHRLGNAGRACPVCPRQRAFLGVRLCALTPGLGCPLCPFGLGGDNGTSPALCALASAPFSPLSHDRLAPHASRASMPERALLLGGLGRQALAARHLPLGERGWSRTRRRSHRGRCSALHPEPGSARESVQHPAPPCVARTWRGVAPLRPRESPLPSAYVLGVQTGLEASCV
jgi:hypothetical protein